MKRTAGKYSGFVFTKEQKQARIRWQRAQAYETELQTALKLIIGVHSRDKLHERLDWVLDTIENSRAHAIQDFPDVDASLVISTLHIRG